MQRSIKINISKYLCNLSSIDNNVTIGIHILTVDTVKYAKADPTGRTSDYQTLSIRRSTGPINNRSTDIQCTSVPCMYSAMYITELSRTV